MEAVSLAPQSNFLEDMKAGFGVTPSNILEFREAVS
jgi:hypothetical protein